MDMCGTAAQTAGIANITEKTKGHPRINNAD